MATVDETFFVRFDVAPTLTLTTGKKAKSVRIGIGPLATYSEERGYGVGGTCGVAYNVKNVGELFADVRVSKDLDAGSALGAFAGIQFNVLAIKGRCV